MKTIKLSIIALIIGVSITLSFGVYAQSLEGIDLPAIPQITKPISQMTIPELKAKIQEIIAVVQQLQVLLAKLRVGISGIPGGYVFNTNLKYGISSQQVIYLQIVLNQNPETRVSDIGPGSLGQESTYFGQKTLQAVIKFQEKYNIQATGYVGPITRTKLNEILQQSGGGTGQQPTTPTTPSTPTTPTTPLPPSETYCGDGIDQRPNSKGQIEECDSNDLLNQTCITKGYTGGILSCTTKCTFDSSRCTSGGTGTGTGISQPAGPVCGDNTDNICPSGCTHSKDTNCTYCGDSIIQSPNQEGISEVCDTTKLNNQTCITKGYGAGGTLKCSSTCLTFDTLSCSLPAPINNLPVLNSIGNKSVNENQQLSFTISATDPENDPLTYSVQPVPSGATFNTSTKIFTWTPSYTQSGTYNVIFTVSDSKLTDTETITITVNNVLACGDTQCTTGETCSNCSQDCGVCPAVCGDGTCSGAEICSTCPGDCGMCTTTTSQISQFGITWTFDKPYQYGQFANRDYWVIGPVTIIGITPASTVTGSRTKNGSMLDPTWQDSYYDAGSHQGLDSAMSGVWDSAMNVARPNGNDLSAENPLVIQPNHSLLSVISVDVVTRYQLSDAAILTILGSVPDANSFRPSYSGTDKTIRYNVSDLDYSGLSTLTPVASAPSLATAESWFERPWLSFHYYFDCVHPVNNMPGRNDLFAERIGEGALVLNLNYTNAQKKTLMIRFVQLGIDLYGILANDGRRIWSSNGAQSQGRKMPILFAGMVLNDPNMKAIGDKSGDYLYSNGYGPENEPPDYVHFAEDDQTFYVDGNDIFTPPYTLRGAYVGTGHDDSYSRGSTIGNVKVVHDSNVVVGIGTSWLGLTYYPTFYFGVEKDNKAYDTGLIQYSAGYVIKSIDSDTQITLTTPYQGDTDETGNAKYIIAGQIYYGHGLAGVGLTQGFDYSEYTSENLGLPEWGINHQGTRYKDGLDWCANYRLNVGRAGLGSHQLTALIMGLKTLWNHDVYFDYVDRYMQIMVGQSGRSLSVFSADMWDTYRANYGCVWTRDNPSDIYSNGRLVCPGPQQCSGADTSCGTYPSCQNCNSSDGCLGTTYRDYSCSGTSCIYTEYTNDSRCFVCTPDQTQSCSTGLLGICSSGTQTCQSNGTWGSCVQNNQPTTENCTDSLDNDCDGATDCSDTDCSSSPACQITYPTDYISFWKFDGNALDEKGVNNGTIYGNPQFVSNGIQGQALSFNGTVDYVNLGTPSRLNLSTISISAWALRIQDTGGVETIITRGNSVSSAANMQYTIVGSFPADDKFNFIVSNGTSTLASTSSLVTSLNIWYHIVGTYDGISTTKIYINGILNDTDTSAGFGNLNYKTDMCIARDIAARYYWNGFIDNVMIFNRALTQGEIQNIYNSQKPAGMGMLEETKLKGLASILDAIKDILEKIKALF